MILFTNISRTYDARKLTFASTHLKNYPRASGCRIASGQKPHKTDTLIDFEYASECDEDYAEEKSIPPNGR